MLFRHSPSHTSVNLWREAAIADGWKHEPTYSNCKEGNACRLSKDGWIALVYSNYGKIPFNAIDVWGPDGLKVDPTFPYSWEALQKGLRVCSYCKKKGIDTTRVGFAGRCCRECLPEMRKKYEYPGWYN